MPEVHEDLQVERPLDPQPSDQDRMMNWVERESEPPQAKEPPEPEKPEQTREPEPEPEEKHEPEQPAVEGEEHEQEQPKTTYDEEEQRAEEEDPIYAITVGGKEEEVPLSELLRGYSRTADYTRKTQALSNEKKEFDDERAHIREQRERYAQMLEQGRQWLESLNPPEPNWEQLRRDDPAEYAAQLTEHQQRNEQMRLIQTEQEKLKQQDYQEHNRALQEHLRSERERLVEALPEWNDPTTAQSEMAELMAFGQTVGFTPDELNNVYDHRAVLTLRKAMLYDKLQSGKPQVVKQARKAPVLKPGASQAGSRKPAASRLTRAREELRKTGSTRAAEDFFFEALKEEG